MQNKYDIIIIGAGLSGLLCGSYLINEGYKVCIIEKNPKIGGAMQVFKRKTYLFETGMHFFGAVNKGQIQNELFKLFGVDDFEEIESIESFKFISGTKEYDLPVDFKKYKIQLLKYFPDEKLAIEKYMDTVGEIIDNITIEKIMEGFEINKFHESSIFDFIAGITENNELRNVFAFNNILYGGQSEKSSVYIHSIINGSFVQSTGMFKKGSYYFMEAMKAKIESKGGVFIASEEIIKLNTNETGIINCESLKGNKYFADKFISTLHPELSLKLTDSKLFKNVYRNRILNLENSYGFFIVYIILKKESFLYQASPVFISNNENVWDKDSISLFLTPFCGKKGKYAEQAEIMMPMSFNDVKKWENTITSKRPNNYKLFKKLKADNLFKIIEQIFPNFADHIEHYYTSTPLTYRDYTGTINGSAYGIVNGYKKPFNSIVSVKTKINNLYFSGQNINFHGMLGVSVTSLLTCQAILIDDKIKNA